VIATFVTNAAGIEEWPNSRIRVGVSERVNGFVVDLDAVSILLALAQDFTQPHDSPQVSGIGRDDASAGCNDAVGSYTVACAELSIVGRLTGA
jgi:hypothetical protein